MSIPAAIARVAIAAYNAALPSIEQQYRRFASDGRSWRVMTRRDAEDMYGDTDDWPDGLQAIIDAHGSAVEIVEGREGRAEWFAPSEAPTLEEYMLRSVQAEGGLLPASSLDDVMTGLATRVDGAEVAATRALMAFAAALGWEVQGSGRYFDLTRRLADGDSLAVVSVRVSDHGTLTRNPHAPGDGRPTINLAPGAHDFDDAYGILATS